MNQLKFRARIKENGQPKMFYQNDQYLISFLRRVTSFLYFEKDAENVDELNGGKHESYLKPYELENSLDRFTGLHDKNGKEIFEGDIVRFQDSLHERIQTGVATFCVDDESKSSGWWLKELSRDSDWTLHFGNTDWLEVIGNIYENKELLEEK
jgi:uncharacterized phage protein (TIGR01671 family)